MSHTVVRGKPYASQLYLDKVLNEVLTAKGVHEDVEARRNVTLAEIIFHSLKKRPQSIYMVNGATGEEFTNEYILRLSVAIARSISAKCPPGSTIMLVMRNHQRMVATYWAALFSGVLPFLMDPNTTTHEQSYFFKLIEPRYVFCDLEHYENLKNAVENSTFKPKLVIAGEENTLAEFTEGFSDNFESFELFESLPESSVLLLPTSGSTGFPKAALMSNRGLVAQMPITWAYHTEFPTPTKMVMLLTTAQWATFTMMVTTCVLYDIKLLISPKMPTVEHVTELLGKYKPTWTFFGPAFARNLLSTIRADQLSSLDSVTLLGAPPTPDVISGFKEKLPKTARLCDGYGSTETQGFIAIPDTEAHINSNGRVSNILHYKIIDDSGHEVKPGNNGELYVKGECVIKGYYVNNDSYNETFIDGWFKTGDWFHIDENERIYFLERRKFSFKFRGNQVAPEEVESVISAVPGVLESIVCETDNGPAAAVILNSNCDVTREQIHHSVKSTLSDHKHLHGGLAIVDGLPHTHTGKLNRTLCKQLIHQLIKEGKCF